MTGSPCCAFCKTDKNRLQPSKKSAAGRSYEAARLDTMALRPCLSAGTLEFGLMTARSSQKFKSNSDLAIENVGFATHPTDESVSLSQKPGIAPAELGQGRIGSRTGQVMYHLDEQDRGLIIKKFRFPQKTELFVLSKHFRCIALIEKLYLFSIVGSSFLFTIGSPLASLDTKSSSEFTLDGPNIWRVSFIEDIADCADCNASPAINAYIAERF